MKISIIGCGNMGRALALCLSKTQELFFYDHHIEKASLLEEEGYGRAFSDVKDALQVKMIILAVKPQSLKEAASLIKEHLQKNQILVSLLAGTTLETLKKYFSSASIVRMMPNLPIIYGEGIVGLSSDDTMSKKNQEELAKLFEPLGRVYFFSEEKINALTALVSSGPAFFFAMIEAMIASGVAMGFSTTDTKELVYHMLQGSLTLLEKTNKTPQELISQIASPQGTTIAGLKTFEELNLKEGIIKTFLDAYKRAEELSD